jgi:hypothetical protein
METHWQEELALFPVFSLSQRYFFHVSTFRDFSFFSRSVLFSPASSSIGSNKSSFQNQIVTTNKDYNLRLNAKCAPQSVRMA